MNAHSSLQTQSITFYYYEVPVSFPAPNAAAGYCLFFFPLSPSLDLELLLELAALSSPGNLDSGNGKGCWRDTLDGEGFKMSSGRSFHSWPGPAFWNDEARELGSRRGRRPFLTGCGGMPPRSGVLVEDRGGSETCEEGIPLFGVDVLLWSGVCEWRRWSLGTILLLKIQAEFGFKRL